MLRKFSQLLYKAADGRLILLILAGSMAFNALVLPAALKDVQNAAGTVQIEGFDMQFFYQPAKAFQLLDSYSAAVRGKYRFFELTGDIVQPILYSLFFSFLISFLFQRGFESGSFMRKLNILPFSAGLSDISENICIVAMLTIYPTHSVAIATIAPFFTMSKWCLLGISVLLVLTGLVKAGLNRFQKQS